VANHGRQFNHYLLFGIMKILISGWTLLLLYLIDIQLRLVEQMNISVINRPYVVFFSIQIFTMSDENVQMTWYVPLGYAFSANLVICVLITLFFYGQSPLFGEAHI
jgi:hypothetical protein